MKTIKTLLLLAVIGLALTACGSKKSASAAVPGEEIQIVENPVFSLAGGSFDAQQILTLSTQTEGAQIYYTLDETDPQENKGILYTQEIPLNQGITVVKAIALKEGLTPSQIIRQVYEINVQRTAVPQFSLTAGQYAGDQTLTLTTLTEGAQIYYTLDETLPTVETGILYNGPIALTEGTVIVKAVAVAVGLEISETVEAIYEIVQPTAEAPVFNLPEGTYDASVLLSLTTATQGAQIYYTLNGDEPGVDTGILYTQEIVLNQGTFTVKAVTVKEGYQNSEKVQKTYLITQERAAAPQFSLDAGQYAGNQTLTLSTLTEGAQIYYTLDETLPTVETGILYNGPMTLTEGTVIVKAVAVAQGFENSVVSERTYLITLPLAQEPVFGTAEGTYATSVQITLSSTTAGARIYYTLNGEDPDENTGILFTQAFWISSDKTLKAVTYADGHLPSPIVTAHYVITAHAPSFALAFQCYTTSAEAGGTRYTLKWNFTNQEDADITLTQAVFNPAQDQAVPMTYQPGSTTVQTTFLLTAASTLENVNWTATAGNSYGVTTQKANAPIRSAGKVCR